MYNEKLESAYVRANYMSTTYARKRKIQESWRKPRRYVGGEVGYSSKTLFFLNTFTCPQLKQQKRPNLNLTPSKERCREWEVEGLSLNIRLLHSRGADGGESFF